MPVNGSVWHTGEADRVIPEVARGEMVDSAQSHIDSSWREEQG